jgi:MFS transporter, DHA1 family, tetracycline resistance protein
VFLIGVPLMALWGFASPAALGLMSRRVGPDEQGQVQGANGSIAGIANMIGPGLFTQVFAAAIAPGQGWHLPGAPFALAALMLVAATVIAWRVTGDGE